jgi:hypothetical protein
VFPAHSLCCVIQHHNSHNWLAAQRTGILVPHQHDHLVSVQGTLILHLHLKPEARKIHRATSHQGTMQANASKKARDMMNHIMLSIKASVGSPHCLDSTDALTTTPSARFNSSNIAIKKVDDGSQRSRDGLDEGWGRHARHAVDVQPISRGQRPCPSLACPTGSAAGRTDKRRPLTQG